MAPRTQRYGTGFGSLLGDDLPPPLGPGMPNAALRTELSQLTLESAFAGKPLCDARAGQCCLAAIWLRHGFLDESHHISQEIDTVDGSFWHAIMHRREQDYGNAKYWFRRVGRHAIFLKLAAEVRQLAAREWPDAPGFLREQTTWNPFDFVDLCEQIAQGRADCATIAGLAARLEWQILFDHCYRQSVGETMP